MEKQAGYITNSRENGEPSTLSHGWTRVGRVSGKITEDYRSVYEIVRVKGKHLRSTVIQNVSAEHSPRVGILEDYC